MDHAIEYIDYAPYFDMELYLQLSDERRLDGDKLKKLSKQWEAWLPHFKTVHIKTEAGGYVLVFLDEQAEAEIEALWEKSPAEGFAINVLAQAMLTSALADIIPESTDAGCTPAPKPTEPLLDALEEAGVEWVTEGTLSRKYAMLTHYPFRGGCEVCFLAENCPKKGGGGMKSWVLGA